MAAQLGKANSDSMSIQENPVLRLDLKRKHESIGDDERANLAPRLRQHQSPCPDHDQEQVCSSPMYHSRSPSQTNQTSLDHSMLDADSSPPDYVPRLPINNAESDHASSLGAWMVSGVNSLNSVRPPDPLVFSDSIPVGIPKIPAFLFHPRPHPILPLHILDLPFDKVIRRYNRLARLVDDYQRWHTRSVFGFWTESDLALAASGEIPKLTEAFNEDRPSIPPYILNTQFDIVLLGAPLLSHLIERYHNDLGYDYFAFYHTDPRDNASDSDFDMQEDPYFPNGL
ncbi:hypothetical protein F5Y12DRAFT_551990 [Xylaria sp. FL1777]|nr:hypothetical protein F5Y12DRAFT_551990 [Xylaria sp. FL1777]